MVGRPVAADVPAIYSVAPEHAGRHVVVRARAGEPHLSAWSPAGILIATHRRAPAGTGQTIRSGEHAKLLEQAVLAAFTTQPACRRKTNHPPGETALAELARLRGLDPAPAAAISLADLVARTARAVIEGRWATTMRFWNGPQLLIIDELGYLPMPGEAASHLFQVSRRYQHGSIVLTTNRGIADWGSIFDDTTVAAAILDRLLHHATVLTITGDSYRMRRHRDAIAALRPALTDRAEGGEFP